MRRILASNIQIKLLPGQTPVYPNISWLLILPVILWGLVTVYVPIYGNSLTTVQTWLAASLVVLLMAASLICHILGHLMMARLFKVCIPDRISLFFFGDPSQIWPAYPSLLKDVLIIFSGPFMNCILAGLAYLLWNAQLNLYLNLSTQLITVFNAWLAIVNLAPVFPFDGGRLIHVSLLRFSGRYSTGSKMIVRLGFLTALAETGWGIFLMVQNARYGLETGLVTILMAILVALGLVNQPVYSLDGSNTAPGSSPARFAGAIMTSLIFIFMAVIASTLLLTNNGIEAPGVALSVEPMVEVPAQYRHQPVGSFMLTSVIQQSPIPAGFWMAGQFSPALKILPPEKIAPNQTSPQESARQGFVMLDQSVTTATVVGLQLAGFNAKEVGKGAGVASILSGSPAKGFLIPGDIITALNGKPVQTAADLINIVKTQDPKSSVSLSILRDQQKKEYQISLMSPAQPGGSPRIGISIQDAGFDYTLPIPVKIVPQKIIGGPSAGLMFTLTLYNMLTSDDLTGGRIIAGTGTINPDGSVGPIGGVQQKVAAAEIAGAVYFLSPVENYADAVTAANHIKVVKVATVKDAITFLKSLPPE